MQRRFVHCLAVAMAMQLLGPAQTAPAPTTPLEVVVPAVWGAIDREGLVLLHCLEDGDGRITVSAHD